MIRIPKCDGDGPRDCLAAVPRNAVKICRIGGPAGDDRIQRKGGLMRGPPGVISHSV